MLYTLLVHCRAFTWTYEGVLMGPEHNSLCWPDSSSSTHFLLVSHYFCSCQLSHPSVSLALSSPLPSCFVPISTVNWSLNLFFVSALSSIHPSSFIQSLLVWSFHLCPLSHDVSFWPPKSINHEGRSLSQQQNQLGGSLV